MAVQASFGTDGIKKLLDAENEAQKIVNEARKFKQDRLKQAKAEADKEILAYKAEREGAYQKKLSESKTGAEKISARLDDETAVNIKKVQQDVNSKKQIVVDTLLNYVTSVQFK